jgi:hypothetical protein
MGLVFIEATPNQVDSFINELSWIRPDIILDDSVHFNVFIVKIEGEGCFWGLNTFRVVKQEEGTFFDVNYYQFLQPTGRPMQDISDVHMFCI